MKRVLVVDDDRDMQDLYRYMLRERGDAYASVFAGGAEEGFRLLREECFDVIVSDVIMRGATGESFIARVRRDPAFSEIPVLVVSVLEPEMLGNLARLKKVSFLQKPVRKEELLAALGRLTGTQPLRKKPAR
jgi:CheY-like chemotaxis protein